MSAAHVARILIHPVKALDAIEVTEAVVSTGGALVGDRRWALHERDEAGEVRFLNGKRCPQLLRLRTSFDLANDELFITEVDGTTTELRFHLASNDGARGFEAFCRTHFGRDVTLSRDDDIGFPDDRAAWGPTVVSTASLEAVCGWFPGISVASARRRFRANLELGGDLPAFWEDRLCGAQAGTPLPFQIGQVGFAGTNPCARCSVPPRDPDTSDAWPGFQKTFAERRRSTLPSWAAAARFDHFYRLAINTRVAASEAGKPIRVGDPVELTA